jgi:hypothetical protein
MPGTKSFLAQELTNWFQAAWLELPAEAGKVLLGAGDEKGLRNAGWKAYDAWVSLANELTNAVYSDPIIGEATGRVMETALRLRQIGGTMAAAFFGNLWPSIGLPTHNEMAALRDELRALREELAAYSAGRPLPGDSAETDTQLPGVWKRTHLNGYPTTNGNSNLTRRSAHQGKRHVAA